MNSLTQSVNDSDNNIHINHSHNGIYHSNHIKKDHNTNKSNYLWVFCLIIFLLLILGSGYYYYRMTY